MRRVVAVVIAAMCALTVAACGLGSGGTVPFKVEPGSIKPNAALEGVKITVGSKEYTEQVIMGYILCLLYTSPSPRDGLLSRMPSSA